MLSVDLRTYARTVCLPATKFCILPLWEICVSMGQPRPQPRRASPCTLPNFWTLPPAATKFHLTSQKRSNLGSLNSVHILILEKADVWLIFESDRLKVEVTRLESVSSAEICLGLQRNRTLFTFSSTVDGATTFAANQAPWCLLLDLVLLIHLVTKHCYEWTYI